ncbi:MAG: sugar ABC transporter substrate-binding protein [Alphaproteobacteria bacterium]
MARRFGSAASVFAATCLAWAAAAAQDRPYDGVTLNLASMNDPFSGPLVTLAERFGAETGITVKVDILSYPELLTKVTADFIGDTGGYHIVTMDNVWAGQFAEAGHSVVLNDWMARDAAEIGLDDIYPVIMTALGNYQGAQVAFPFSGYANVLAYRTDLYDKAGLQPPSTMEELVAAAKALTDRDANQYGWVANGQRGPAVAQDWMQYNSQMGGSIMGADGLPAINAPANVASLAVYKQLFDEAAPPGAVDYDWGGREESFRQGLVANMQTWSVGAAGYDNPDMSKVVGLNRVVFAPTGEGLPPRCGVGGWGLAINADIDDTEQAAAWEFIKWITSPAIQKEMSLLGGGGYIRASTTADPELQAKYPFLPVIDQCFVNGDGDFRPRIPEYPEIQDILGSAVNAVLAGGEDPQAALDEAQDQAMGLF